MAIQKSTNNLQEYDHKKLHKATLKFMETMSVTQTYQKIVNETMKLVSADCCSLFLKEKDGLDRIYAYPKGLFKNKIRRRGYTYRAFLKNNPSIVHASQIEKNHPAIRDIGIKATIYVPLINKKKHLGILSVDFFHDKGDFKKELKTLEIFSTFATMAIRKAQLYSEVENTIKERDLFISLAAHEIRTPLTILVLYSDLLQKSAQLNLPCDKKIASVLYRESRMLKEMTDELLSVDAVKNNLFQYNFTVVNLVDILEVAALKFRAIHRQKIKLETAEEKIEVIADEAKLMQVFTNILNNAAKYSPPNSKVEVKLELKKKSVTVKIKDEGIGIKKDNIGKIFNKFTAFENKQNGLGIGLYLSKNIVEMHKGRISAKSKPKMGTQISITLPVKNYQEERIKSAAQPLYSSL